MKAKILQLFNWRLNDIINVVGEVEKQGFTHIQISPLQGLKQTSGEWWALYQPTNFKIGNIKGNKEDLKRLCCEAHKHHIKIVADVVLHHVANRTSNDISPKVDFDVIECGFREPLFYPESFTNIKDYNNWYDCTHGSLGGLPALNLSNERLREIQYEYLIELKECGVDSFRFDALKHLSPDNNYFEEMINYVGKDIIHDSYGECIENTPQPIIEAYQKYMKVGVGETDQKDDPNLVAWVYSHDDQLSFHKKSPDKWYLYRQYEHLLRDYKADVLFYAEPFDDYWKCEEIRLLNILYK